MSKKLIAARRFPYSGRMFNEGDPVPTPNETEAELLVALGHARYMTRNLETGSEKQSNSRQQPPRIITKAA